MITLNNCNIIVEDDIHPAVDCKGVVVINGESPNAKVRLSAPDYDGRRFRAFDRLSEASYSESRGSYTISGVSNHLRKTVGARKNEATITVLVTPDQPCNEDFVEPETVQVEVVEEVFVEQVEDVVNDEDTTETSRPWWS